MALDIKKFLKDELGFTDAEITPELVAVYTPERVTKLEAAVKRQSEFSRGMDELRVKQQELDAANTQLQEEMVAWGAMTAEQKAANTKLQGDLLASQQEAQRLALQVTQLAEKAGVDPKTLTQQPPVHTPAGDSKLPDNVLTTDHLTALNNQLNGVANMALTLPATLAMIAAEHQQLTGKTLDQRAIIAEIQKRAGTKGNTKPLDPEAIWIELHGIEGLRTEAATKAHDAEIAAAEERGRQAARTEALVPGSHSPNSTHARIFNKPDGTARTSVLNRPAPGQTANAAATAFATGRYRQQTTTPGGNAMPAGRT